MECCKSEQRRKTDQQCQYGKVNKHAGIHVFSVKLSYISFIPKASDIVTMVQEARAVLRAQSSSHAIHEALQGSLIELLEDPIVIQPHLLTIFFTFTNQK